MRCGECIHYTLSKEKCKWRQVPKNYGWCEQQAFPVHASEAARACKHWTNNRRKASK